MAAQFDKTLEPLLTGPTQYTFHPIKYPDIYVLYQTMMRATWQISEVKMNDDESHWNDVLSDDERFFIKNVLAFFASADGIVAEHLAVTMYTELANSEAQAMIAKQLEMETVHSEMYSILIDTYVSDPTEKALTFQAIATNAAVKRKAEWALRWITNGTFPERVLAFALVEGVFFSSSFCALYWIKQRHPGKLEGLTVSNDFIARDENLHVEGAVAIYDKIVQKLPEKTVHEMVASAVDAETFFVRESLPVALVGINADRMVAYVKFVADFWVEKLGYAKLYDDVKACPFDFMLHLGLRKKENFFEVPTSSYQKRALVASKLELTEDF